MDAVYRKMIEERLNRFYFFSAFMRVSPNTEYIPPAPQVNRLEPTLQLLNHTVFVGISDADIAALRIRAETDDFPGPEFFHQLLLHFFLA